MRISIRDSANRLRTAPRVSNRDRAAAPEPAGRQANPSAIDFSPVHGRHCICSRCVTVRATHPDRSAA